MFVILEQLLDKYNRPRRVLKPEGFVIHATSNPGATAQNHYKYFNSGDRQSSAHYVADWQDIIRLIPENEIAWHAGPSANSKYLSVEMCEPKGHNVLEFQQVWERTVWLVADAFVRYGWGVTPGLWSHDGISKRYHETDHTDPIGFFKEYGRTFADFVTEVDALIRKTKQGKGEKEMEHVIAFWTAKDFSGAIQIAERLGNCLLTCRDGKPELNARAKSAQHLIVIGGKEVTDHPNVTNLCGATGPDTAILAAEYAKKLEGE
jgi:N-acetylmuramoyl-L-alanine amidase